MLYIKDAFQYGFHVPEKGYPEKVAGESIS